MALNVAEKRILTGIAVVLVLVAGASSLFVVDESEYAVVLRFGRVITVIEEPGLKVKLPAPIDQIRRFDKRVLYQQISQTEFLSADKKNVLVSSYLTWRIQSPSVFLQALSNRDSAESRLSTLVKSSLGAALGNRPFTDYIPETPNESSPVESGGNLLRLEDVVFDGISGVAAADYGIEVVSFGISRFSFPQQNLLAVFARMRAERERIASAYRSEGAAEATKILANAERERREILAKAESEAEILRGKSEAEAASIYAEAYATDPEFYGFLRKLETYEKIIDEQTTVIVPADSGLLDLLTTEDL
ncbi:MAG: protease modulator HflC [Pseudomonadota bacterium]